MRIHFCLRLQLLVSFHLKVKREIRYREMKEKELDIVEMHARLVIDVSLSLVMQFDWYQEIANGELHL